MAALIRHKASAVLAVAAVGLAAMLVACTVQPTQSITLEYERDGQTRTVVVHPETADCDGGSVYGVVAKQNGEVGFFDFRLPTDLYQGIGSGSFIDGEHVVRFNADDFTQKLIDDRYVLDRMPISAEYIETGKEFDAPTHQSPGYLSANLRCDS